VWVRYRCDYWDPDWKRMPAALKDLMRRQGPAHFLEMRAVLGYRFCSVLLLWADLIERFGLVPFLVVARASGGNVSEVLERLLPVVRERLKSASDVEDWGIAIAEAMKAHDWQWPLFDFAELRYLLLGLPNVDALRQFLVKLNSFENSRSLTPPVLSNLCNVAKDISDFEAYFAIWTEVDPSGSILRDVGPSGVIRSALNAARSPAMLRELLGQVKRLEALGINQRCIEDNATLVRLVGLGTMIQIEEALGERKKPWIARRALSNATNMIAAHGVEPFVQLIREERDEADVRFATALPTVGRLIGRFGVGPFLRLSEITSPGVLAGLC
jgi:hypothetical protein